MGNPIVTQNEPDLKAWLQNNGNVEKITDVTTVTFAHTTVITIYTEAGQISIKGYNKDLAKTFYQVAERARGKTIGDQLKRVATITPEEVVIYFEESPVLREMADDVREVLLGRRPTAPAAITEDVNRCRHLINPTKADIAEILTGSRYYGGQSHKRISAVFDALTSSSPAQKDFSTQNGNLLAA